MNSLNCDGERSLLSRSIRAVRPDATWTRRVLTAAAFAAVLGFAGCGSLKSTTEAGHAPTTQAFNPEPMEPTTADPTFATFDRPVQNPSPSVVSLFGEFEGQRPTRVMPPGEIGFQQHTFLEEGNDNDVAIDPTGKWMAFSSTRNSEKADIFLQRNDGLSVTQLTSDPADDAFPAFSPDGKTVAFCSTRAGNWDIYTMDLDGKSAVQVTNAPAQEMHPTFSPDGTRLAYCSLGRTGQWELWVADLKTNEKKMIGYGLFPSWSPNRDKDQLVFQRARQRGSRWFSLWTLDLVNGEARRFTEVAVSTNAAIVSPTWSPDGRAIAFSTIVEPAKTQGGRPTGQQDVWTINADGSNRHRITDGSGTNATPCWAKDGRLYFISDRGGPDCIWSANVGSTPAPSSGATAKVDMEK